MKRPKIALRSSIVLFVSLVLSACGGVQKEPSNIITDRKGLSIDLDWTTSTSIPAALVEADLELDVYNDAGEILSSYNSSEFEHVDFASQLKDGVYTVVVSLTEIAKRSDYTLKIGGASNSKTFSVSGFFSPDSVQSKVSIATITKTGKQFALSTF